MCFFCFGVGCFNAVARKIAGWVSLLFLFCVLLWKECGTKCFAFWFGGVFGGEIGVAFTFVCVTKLGLCDFVFHMIESFKFVLFDISSLG